MKVGILKAMQKPKREKFFTLMLVPHDSGHPLMKLRISLSVLKFVVLFVFLSVSVLGFSLMYSSFLSGRLIHYRVVVSNNKENQERINFFVSLTSNIKDEMQDILDKNNELRKVLGLKIEKKKIEIAKYQIKDLGHDTVSKINSNLKVSQNALNLNKENVSELKKRTNYLLNKIASTPSVWPAYGKIVSWYGYRRYPWRGFHTGLDISGRYGNAVRVTAPGVVTYAGWRSGYGKTVMVRHGQGFTTLYAHLSKFNVRIGQKVGRRQVIAYIGNTGYSTGPHLHYEVRRNNAPINPVAFLNLNVLRASKYF
jgi:murein DD-endopeptidase MepM/ murein hydrolase activator NlpD